ncbi:MAG: hypothetical protein Q9194_006355 [Teloschistes cf. exilis]
MGPHWNISIRMYAAISRHSKANNVLDGSRVSCGSRCVASMGRLEALYVPFPPIVANEKLKCRELDRYLDCALQIPSLKALNLNTWPYPLFTQIDDPTIPSHPAPYISRPWQTSDQESVDISEDFYDHCHISPRPSFSGALSSSPTPIDISRL